jgi:hypothetical protein
MNMKNQVRKSLQLALMVLAFWAILQVFKSVEKTETAPLSSPDFALSQSNYIGLI